LKRIVLLLAVTAISVLALAVPAFAQGQVERGPEHAKSICSFSGLNENPDAESPPFPAGEGGRVQSYGDYVKEGLKGADHVPSPGIACNPTRGPSGPFLPPD
jgi:hypothetical protein